ncbi:MAG: transposase, partial [Planctomycetaceae bacterium]|nr:transposase [Planctomycetaceae bacterium]
MEAGYRASILMTIVSTAHRHHLDVWLYLKDVLDRLLQGERDLDALRADRWAQTHPEALRPPPHRRSPLPRRRESRPPSAPPSDRAATLTRAMSGRSPQRHGDVLRPVCGVRSPKKRHTRSFARYVVDLSRFMTLKDVPLHLGVSWDTVKEIQRRHLETRYARPKLKGVRRIAIDEISVGKGHQYVTVVLDLDSGAVVFVGEGKGAD